MSHVLQYPLHNILEARSRLGEGPIWDSTKKLLYWIDIFNHRVHQFDPVTGENRFFDVGDVPGAIAIAGQDKLTMALRHHLAFLNIKTGEVTPILEVEKNLPNNRLNDGKCDAQGRFWFGSMSTIEKPEASLYRYDIDGSLHVMETGLTISNGLGWSPDEKIFYLTDSPQQKIYAYDFNSVTGNISNRRIFVDLTQESFYPDGLTIDSQGNIWSAMWNGWCVICFNPQGEERLRIKLPVPLVTSCTFGGENLQTLYITTASVGLSQAEIDKSFYSGDLFAVETDVTGLPSYGF
ncbi:MAG: SMP-30/gluconolactonase/LRE family protein [Nostoc sp. ZfuVER08]|jgi:sugar lactone lactonase YvrE|uniref:SMP-30/gluconolactonase/LRE family protein n=1 Tax=Nostoc punctiforme FACHB-252 TaxID=1357509 RepID=A0ABR8H4Z0_NOSPU|nr:SMP-30/gluconolactonase/LRE family protein [Nostoc punctiforme]MBD2610684.1 SMP-30/gluconolactonase/LRE family protein [Nostoc punctiforme FACHB-252]MBL1198461.1 SMP-30/gluconolactonase/LRE family protein [Nostoc sp. GBBB01]MDZ8014758.1 SMP-30/gluconolactonase/LRE family protein [Nostoc sp. ZfuVER08]